MRVAGIVKRVGAGVVVAGLASWSPSASAIDPAGTFVIHGTGLSSCQDWARERKAAGAVAWQYQQWVLGYLSAYNEWAPGRADILDPLDADGAFAWIDDWCESNVDRTLAMALQALVGARAAAPEGEDPAGEGDGDETELPGRQG